MGPRKKKHNYHFLVDMMLASDAHILQLKKSDIYAFTVMQARVGFLW